MTVAVRCESRVGKRPVVVPKTVSVNVAEGGMIRVEGPKGKLSMQLPRMVELVRDADKIKITSCAPGRDAPRLQGLVRALLASLVKGTSEGYLATLELVGTGYRCEILERNVNLQLGLSHVATYRLPEQVSGVVPPESKGSVLVLSSPDKAALGQAVASIRHLRPPEPYGGKGVRLRGEKIRQKAGKAGKTGKGRGK
ncbi:50S ribosomal protein L6 [Myxococcota bacterium]